MMRVGYAGGMFASVRNAMKFMTRGQKMHYVILLTGRSLVGLLDVVGVLLVGIIASVATSSLTPGSGASTPVVIAGFQLPTITSADLPALAALVLVIFVGKSVIAIIFSRRLSLLIAKIEERNAARIFEEVLEGSLSQIRELSKSEYQFAVVRSSTAAFGGILNTFAIIVSESFLLAVIALTFVVFDPMAALFALLYFALLGVILQRYLGRKLKSIGEEITEGTIGSNNVISDALDSFREISVMQRQKLFIQQLRESRIRVAMGESRAVFMSGMPRYIVETALVVGVVALVAQQLLSNGPAAGIVTIGVFLAGGMRIMASLLPLQNSLALVKMHVAQAVLSFSLLNKLSADGAHSLAAPVAGALSFKGAKELVGVDVRNVTLQYPGELTPTLRNINFTILPGEFAAIIGQSGAGKTTLVDAMLGLINPNEGEVNIGGRTPGDIRRENPGLIAYVPQRPGIVSGTIAENIALGIPENEIDWDAMREAVEAANLTTFIESLPDGLHSSVGKQVNSLSGGQIQRVGLARALYSKPRLLIMDEATSALDAGSEAFISESLKTLHGQVTTVVIAHRLSTIQHADRVLVLDAGSVLAEGDFPTLIKTVPMVAEYVKLMSISHE
jgi:ABC-type multidrug transport system fused ATPase/permease subunit